MEQNVNSLRLAVPDGVARRLLRDPVQVRSCRVILNSDLTFSPEVARHGEPLGNLYGKFIQGRRKPPRIDVDRVQSAGQVPRLRQRFVYEAGDLAHVRDLVRRFARQPVRQALAGEGDSGQLLAQSVVEVLTDAPLLVAADFEDLALELAPLRDVMDDSREHTSVTD